MSECRKIGIMTSGGDAPGMNAAVRGVVRAALNAGWQAYGIRDAYRGLVEGGSCIVPLDWAATSASFREGGTLLGSARYTDIKGDGAPALALKRRALETLRQLGIRGLVVIGGDGSLTGATELAAFARTEGWGGGEPLYIVGIPGSIDNDIPCTDMSVGVDTTLNTIVECIDKLRDTATSHKRISIVEVMGRLRGYLAVMSGLATGADRIFIREQPVSQEEIASLLDTLRDSFTHGQQAGIIIRSEGAVFSTAFIKETIANLLKPPRDVRETILGHLQRGGCPTAFERVLAMRMGVKAVQVLAEKPAEPVFVGIRENRITATPLADMLGNLQNPQFKETLSHNAQNALRLAGMLESTPHAPRGTKKVAILTDGNNVSGMNMAVRAVARLAINRGMAAAGIKGGFSGLVHENPRVLDLQWEMLEMKSILRRPGSLLGVSHDGAGDDDDRLRGMVRGLERLGIDGLITIGNLRSYHTAHQLAQTCGIPVVGIPADANCNLPGTNWVIGMDSALNDLARGIDRAADAAHVQKKVFIIHLKWEYCYCLVHLAAIAGGADQLIIDVRESEEQDPAFFHKMVLKKIGDLKKTIDRGKQSATVIFFSRFPERSERSLEFIKSAVVDAGIPYLPTVVPLETSYGGSIPTAFDRTLSQRFGEQAFSALQEKMEARESSFQIVGFSGKGVIVNPYREYIDGIDNGCPPDFVAELQNCFALMSQAGAECVGIGGEVRWTAAGSGGAWEGVWTCKQCGTPQPFSLTGGSSQWFHCTNDACYNYGYISTSRST